MEKRALDAEKQRDDALDKAKRSVCSIMKQLLNWKKNGEKPETACTDQS